MKIIQLPCLKDNYAFLVTCLASGETAVIDTPDGPKIAKAAREHGLRVTTLVNTHHHWDHAGGNEFLAAHFSGLKICGSRYDADHGRVPCQTHALKEGDRIQIGRLTFEVLEIPGHTLGHFALLGEGVLFSGDTLFAGGCGRLFEGTPERMVASLSKLRALPNDTSVYCGHEYTLQNLAFALSLEPEHEFLRHAYARAQALRAQELSTLPVRLGDEKRYNPFLRWDDPSLKTVLERKIGLSLKDEIQVFSALRTLKNQYNNL